MKRRPRSLGRIFLRGRIYWIQYSFRGKKFWESSASHKESDAARLLKKRLGEMGRGQLIGVSAERLTFEQMAEMLLNDYRIKERKSIERATSSIKQLQKRFGMARAVDITTTAIKDYVRQRKEDTPPAMPATIQKELAALKRMFSLALEEDVLSSMPKFPKIAVSNARQGFFESVNFDDVVQHLPDHHQSLARFAYMTGWRKSEVMNIEWRQVDLMTGWVRLEPGTTKVVLSPWPHFRICST